MSTTDMKYRTWQCKVVILDVGEQVTDSFPRRAVIDMVNDTCGDVIACFSGWNGKLNNKQMQIVEAKMVNEEVREVLNDLNCLKTENEKLAYLATVMHER